MGGVKTFDAVNAFAKVNMMDPKQVGYQDSIDIIHEELHKTRKSFVKIGWYLKHINEEKMYAEDGYSNIYEFAHEKFNISQPTATRFINLCIEFSVGHDSPELDEKYFDFSVSQLFEMLPMKPEDKEKITSDMTVKEIREVKKENRSLNEPKDENIKSFYNKRLKGISAEDRENLKSYMIENYGKSHSSGGPNPDFQCTPRGITINDSDEITWTRFVNRINELIPMEDIESEAVENADDNIPGQTSIEKDFPEYMPDSGAVEESLQEEKYATSHENEVDKQEIIDGEYREVESPVEDNLDEKENAAESVQAALPVFKNNEQRKAWLEDVEAWGLWYEDQNIQARYYKYDFPDGSRLIAVKYRYTCPPWMKNNSNFKENAEFDGSYRDAHYHMIYSEEYKKNHKNEYENYYTHSTVSITALIDFIKEIAKQG